MMRRSVVFVVSVVAALLMLSATSSCDDAPAAEPCTNVPEGGCPLSRGVACEDPTCLSVYACRPGNVWELERTCPPRDAAAGDAPIDAREGSTPFDASIDAPPGANGGPGCDSLQEPDCPLALALACGAGCCGCEDLFVCQNSGWTYWSTCKQ